VIVDHSPASGLALVEPDDFKAFKLRLRNSAEVRPALSGVVFVDDANALVAIDAVTALPGVPPTDAWQTGFRKMIDYADTRGWIDHATHSIRAHVERTP
jgi:hypothetical protein